MQTEFAKSLSLGELTNIALNGVNASQPHFQIPIVIHNLIIQSLQYGFQYQMSLLQDELNRTQKQSEIVLTQQNASIHDLNKDLIAKSQTIEELCSKTIAQKDAIVQLEQQILDQKQSLNSIKPILSTALLNLEEENKKSLSFQMKIKLLENQYETQKFEIVRLNDQIEIAANLQKHKDENFCQQLQEKESFILELSETLKLRDVKIQELKLSAKSKCDSAEMESKHFEKQQKLELQISELKNQVVKLKQQIATMQINQKTQIENYKSEIKQLHQKAKQSTKVTINALRAAQKTIAQKGLEVAPPSSSNNKKTKYNFPQNTTIQNEFKFQFGAPDDTINGVIPSQSNPFKLVRPITSVDLCKDELPFIPEQCEIMLSDFVNFKAIFYKWTMLFTDLEKEFNETRLDYLNEIETQRKKFRAYLANQQQMLEKKVDINKIQTKLDICQMSNLSDEVEWQNKVRIRENAMWSKRYLQLQHILGTVLYALPEILGGVPLSTLDAAKQDVLSALKEAETYLKNHIDSDKLVNQDEEIKQFSKASTIAEAKENLSNSLKRSEKIYACVCDVCP